MIGPPLHFGVSHIPSFLLIATPVYLSIFNVGFVYTLLWLLLIFALHLAISLRSLYQPESYKLETIGASHFVEYVRWCMDTLRLDYEEVENVGILGVLAFGRMVPTLHIPKYKTSIGNSKDIVRYLYGKHMLQGRADFLKPTASNNAVELEEKFEKLGLYSRQWTYFYLFDTTRSPEQSKILLLRLWGINQLHVPLWQRVALRYLWPVFKLAITRFLNISEQSCVRARENINKIFDEVDGLLGDGRTYILQTTEKTYLDMYLACMAAPVLRPPEYSGGRLEPASQASLEEMLPAQQAEIEKWRSRPTGQFVLRLFAKERMAPASRT